MSPGAPPRVVVAEVSPRIDGGRHPVKRVEGEPVVVGATVFADGHDVLHVVLSHRPPGSSRWVDVPMIPVNPGLDRWEATFVPVDQGTHPYKVLGWIDGFATWAHGTSRKLEAGQAVDSELLAGAALLEADAEGAPRRDAALLKEAAARLRSGDLSDLTDPGSDDRPSAATLHRRRLRRADAGSGPVVEVVVERERALFSTWYELFPRSTFVTGPTAADESAPLRHGTLRGVAEQLDRIAEMGFDVLYLPPVHPIGTSFRKGPENAETAGRGDPGSPWAIGSSAGGHTSVHPELGTLEDLHHLVEAAAATGVEIALDLAFQCSPDHPWVTEHPEWFAHRPDGTIQYAENPPKRYQDIYPLDFSGSAWRELWEALLEVAEFWMDRGIRIFRVDNPHTKPFAFWEWFIAQLRRRDPEVVLLSEAFSRPAIMAELAKVGFTQSYTYFTWRTTKAELTDYAREVTTGPGADASRPNFWPNTPDILAWHLQGASRAMFALRHLLAATLSASYGVYGPAFELCENVPAGNGKEEYGRSEKYELRRWELDADPSLRDQLTRVNRVRHECLALHTNRTLRFHHAPNDQVLAYSKTTHDGPDPDPARPARNPVLVVVNLDDREVQRATLELDLASLGIDPSRPFHALDLLTGRRFAWEGAHPFVELDPERQPGHLLRISQPPADGTDPRP
ncbi:MAG: alpha-1,4-glucan--maltose-1-phosphate maltosyltransferase [Acidimicrobiales bacterium]|jgi:starch synthase (maltosyl-transferring)|nr:alpha-1,4-glucan--maltose-1-phosphate maltosyltransferase [Acidimicrobiales bacterium]